MAAHEAVLEDTLSCGIKTTEVLDSEPYAFRVDWINWDSGLRGSGLEVGDRVVAVDGITYERAQRNQFRMAAVGQALESQHWDAIGARDGQPVTLTVRRSGMPGPHTLELSGTVRAERQWSDDDGKQTLGPGGPRRLVSDGFNESWSSWYDDQVWFASRVLDQGWRGFVSNNRNKLAEHRESRPRVDFLCKTYPGPFADVILADWEKVDACLLGRPYELHDADLAWRASGAQPAGPTPGLSHATVAPDAPPEQVMQAYYDALKAGDEGHWRDFFAMWDADRYSDGRVEFRPDYRRADADVSSQWERARGLILGPVYDVRVVAVDDVQTLLVGTEFEGAPRVERVVVEVEHVGRFDGEYRAFVDHTFSRTWELQRLDGGPWQIRATDKFWF